MSTELLIQRFGDAILQPFYELKAQRSGIPYSRKSGVPGILQVAESPMEALGGVTMGQLAAAAGDPTHPFNERVEVACHVCRTTRYTTSRLFAALTACDACVAAAATQDRLDKIKTYWEALCPPAFRETTKDHPDFPKAAYAATRAWQGGDSLLLYGPTGSGKTRLAVWLLKRCLVRNSAHVGILWPEQLKHVKYAHDRLELVEKWGRYEILLMDDALLTGAQDERITDWLMDLLSFRMRYKRPIIITSQVGGDDYREQANKFSNLTKVDAKRVEALLRRVKEICRVVAFVPPVIKAGEDQF